MAATTRMRRPTTPNIGGTSRDRSGDAGAMVGGDASVGEWAMSNVPVRTRSDFAFPFHIDAASGQAAQASYEDHVDQMIRQILLTDPGERVCLPTFGAGLRRLLFAPLTTQLQASATLIITQSLTASLSNQITVQEVTVQTAASTLGVPDGVVNVTISYVLIETQSARQTTVQVI